mmetsp:Transcript_23441/g.58275  ORF Transcript_23441/g.58275 Transcript_23441/m.58275 type:complete len:310 (-) Transcript_23441:1089-2018(-)
MCAKNLPSSSSLHSHLQVSRKNSMNAGWDNLASSFPSHIFAKRAALSTPFSRMYVRSKPTTWLRNFSASRAFRFVIVSREVTTVLSTRANLAFRRSTLACRFPNSKRQKLVKSGSTSTLSRTSTLCSKSATGCSIDFASFANSWILSAISSLVFTPMFRPSKRTFSSAFVNSFSNGVAELMPSAPSASFNLSSNFALVSAKAFSFISRSAASFRSRSSRSARTTLLRSASRAMPTRLRTLVSRSLRTPDSPGDTIFENTRSSASVEIVKSNSPLTYFSTASLSQQPLPDKSYFLKRSSSSCSLCLTAIL